jgi:simple sugar transport system permease protein
LCGVLIFGLLSNILQLHNINSNLQLVLKGIIIVATVLLQERNLVEFMANLRLALSRPAPTQSAASEEAPSEMLSRQMGGSR